jgi:preprotein translocase subunit SecA
LIRQQVVYSIYKTGDAIDMAPEIIASFQKDEQPKNLQFAGAVKEATDNSRVETIDLVHDKMKGEDGKVVGRNDLCPCGSGLKYKKCHGK